MFYVKEFTFFLRFLLDMVKVLDAIFSLIFLDVSFIISLP